MPKQTTEINPRESAQTTDEEAWVDKMFEGIDDGTPEHTTDAERYRRALVKIRVRAGQAAGPIDSEYQLGSQDAWQEAADIVSEVLPDVE